MRTFKRNPLRFTYDGRPIEGQEGDSVGSALYAAGVRIFSRSFQYHRPRGLFCVNGRCVNCAVRINGHPHVRACAVPLEPGMAVESEGAWPRMSFDLLRALDFFHFLFPLGFQYRYFIKPRWMFRIWERMLRQTAPHAAVPRPSDTDRGPPQILREATDVVVVGGGPTGLAAAVSAGGQGLRVTIIDDNTQLGGSLASAKQESSRNALENILADFAGLKTATTHSNTRCFAYYGDGPVCAFRGTTLIEITAKAVVIATGAYERPLVFGNNDLPGIFLSSGALRLLNQYGVRPGTRAVVATTVDDGFEAAMTLLSAGMHVEAVIDYRTGAQTLSTERLQQRGVKLLQGYRVDRAHGLGKVTGVTVVPIAEKQAHAVRRLDCDTLVTCGGFQPANELAFQATSQGDFLMEGVGGWKDLMEGERQLTARDGTPLFVAGNATFIGGLEKSLQEGRIAGLAAASRILDRRDALDDELRREREGLVALSPSNHWSAGTPGNKAFVCFCMDVTDAAIQEAVRQGFKEPETIKRFTGAFMGPCQGKTCAANVLGRTAEITGVESSAMRVPTCRPPLVPVPIRLLVAGAEKGPGNEAH